MKSFLPESACISPGGLVSAVTPTPGSALRYGWQFMVPGLADRIFVWSFRDISGYTLETSDRYNLDRFGQLHSMASQFIGDQLGQFYAEFSEWFNLAEFPDVDGQLDPPEIAIYLKAAGVPDDVEFNSIDGHDCFRGLCAVIRHRLDQDSLEQLKLAAELFNWTIDFGLLCCDTTARAVIKVGSAADVAPPLLERILNRLPDDNRQRSPTYQAAPSGVEQRFLPLAPVLTMLKETVESGDWVQNPLALRLFFWIAEMYQAEIESEAG